MVGLCPGGNMPAHCTPCWSATALNDPSALCQSLRPVAVVPGNKDKFNIFTGNLNSTLNKPAVASSSLPRLLSFSSPCSRSQSSQQLNKEFIKHQQRTKNNK